MQGRITYACKHVVILSHIIPLWTRIEIGARTPRKTRVNTAVILAFSTGGHRSRRNYCLCP
jgi:hypothetical protein